MFFHSSWTKIDLSEFLTANSSVAGPGFGRNSFPLSCLETTALLSLVIVLRKVDVFVIIGAFLAAKVLVLDILKVSLHIHSRVELLSIPEPSLHIDGLVAAHSGPL